MARLSLLFIEVIHPSPTYHCVLLTSLVSPSPAVTVSHNLFVLVGMITQVPAHGHPSLSAKTQRFACPLVQPQVEKCVLIPYHIQPVRSLLGVAQKAGPRAAKGAASSAESWAPARCSAFNAPCPGQSTTSYRAWSSVPYPLTEMPHCNPKLGGSSVSCFYVICSTRQGNPARVRSSGLAG